MSAREKPNSPIVKAQSTIEHLVVNLSKSNEKRRRLSDDVDCLKSQLDEMAANVVRSKLRIGELEATNEYLHARLQENNATNVVENLRMQLKHEMKERIQLESELDIYKQTVDDLTNSNVYLQEELAAARAKLQENSKTVTPLASRVPQMAFQSTPQKSPDDPPVVSKSAQELKQQDEIMLLRNTVMNLKTGFSSREKFLRSEVDTRSKVIRSLRQCLLEVKDATTSVAVDLCDRMTELEDLTANKLRSDVNSYIDSQLELTGRHSDQLSQGAEYRCSGASSLPIDSTGYCEDGAQRHVPVDEVDGDTGSRQRRKPLSIDEESVHTLPEIGLHDQAQASRRKRVDGSFLRLLEALEDEDELLVDSRGRSRLSSSQSSEYSDRLHELEDGVKFLEAALDAQRADYASLQLENKALQDSQSNVAALTEEVGSWASRAQELEELITLLEGELVIVRARESEMWKENRQLKVKLNHFMQGEGSGRGDGHVEVLVVKAALDEERARRSEEMRTAEEHTKALQQQLEALVADRNEIQEHANGFLTQLKAKEAEVGLLAAHVVALEKQLDDARGASVRLQEQVRELQSRVDEPNRFETPAKAVPSRSDSHVDSRARAELPSMTAAGVTSGSSPAVFSAAHWRALLLDAEGKLQQIERERSALEAERDELLGLMDNLNLEVKQLRSAMASTEQRAKNAESSIEKLNWLVLQLEEKCDAYKSEQGRDRLQITLLTSANKALEDRRGEWSMELFALKTQLDSLQDYKDRYTTLVRDKELVDKQYIEARSEFKNKSTEVELLIAQNTELMEMVKKSSSETEILQGKLAASVPRERFVSLGGKLKELRLEHSRVVQEMEVLKMHNLSFMQSISQSSAEVLQLRSQLSASSALSISYQAQQQSLSTATAENTRLADELDKLKYENFSLNDIVKQLKLQSETAANQVKFLEAEIGTHIDTILACRQEVVQSQAEVTELQTALADHRTRLTDSESQVSELSGRLRLQTSLESDLRMRGTDMETVSSELKAELERSELFNLSLQDELEKVCRDLSTTQGNNEALATRATELNEEVARLHYQLSVATDSKLEPPSSPRTSVDTLQFSSESNFDEDLRLRSENSSTDTDLKADVSVASTDLDRLREEIRVLMVLKKRLGNETFQSEEGILQRDRSNLDFGGIGEGLCEEPTPELSLQVATLSQKVLELQSVENLLREELAEASRRYVRDMETASAQAQHAAELQLHQRARIDDLVSLSAESSRKSQVMLQDINSRDQEISELKERLELAALRESDLSLRMNSLNSQVSELESSEGLLQLSLAEKQEQVDLLVSHIETLEEAERTRESLVRGLRDDLRRARESLSELSNNTETEILSLKDRIVELQSSTGFEGLSPLEYDDMATRMRVMVENERALHDCIQERDSRIRSLEDQIGALHAVVDRLVEDSGSGAEDIRAPRRLKIDLAGAGSSEEVDLGAATHRSDSKSFSDDDTFPSHVLELENHLRSIMNQSVVISDSHLNDEEKVQDESGNVIHANSTNYNADLLAKIDTLEAEKRNDRLLLHDREAEIESLVQRLADADVKISLFGSQIIDMEVNGADLQVQLDRALSASGPAIETLCAIIADLEAYMLRSEEAATATTEGYKCDIDALRNCVEELMGEAQQYVSKIETLAGRMIEVESSEEVLQNRLHERELELSRVEEVSKRLQAREASFEELNMSLQLEIEDLQEQVRHYGSREVSVEEATREKDLEIKALVERCSVMMTSVASLEKFVREKDDEILGLRERVRELEGIEVKAEELMKGLELEVEDLKDRVMELEVAETALQQLNDERDCQVRVLTGQVHDLEVQLEAMQTQGAGTDALAVVDLSEELKFKNEEIMLLRECISEFEAKETASAEAADEKDAELVVLREKVDEMERNESYLEDQLMLKQRDVDELGLRLAIEVQELASRRDSIPPCEQCEERQATIEGLRRRLALATAPPAVDLDLDFGGSKVMLQTIVELRSQVAHLRAGGVMAPAPVQQTENSMQSSGLETSVSIESGAQVGWWSLDEGERSAGPSGDLSNNVQESKDLRVKSRRIQELETLVLEQSEAVNSLQNELNQVRRKLFRSDSGLDVRSSSETAQSDSDVMCLRQALDRSDEEKTALMDMVDELTQRLDEVESAGTIEREVLEMLANDRASLQLREADIAMQLAELAAKAEHDNIDLLTIIEELKQENEVLAASQVSGGSGGATRNSFTEGRVDRLQELISTLSATLQHASPAAKSVLLALNGSRASLEFQLDYLNQAASMMKEESSSMEAQVDFLKHTVQDLRSSSSVMQQRLDELRAEQNVLQHENQMLISQLASLQSASSHARSARSLITDVETETATQKLRDLVEIQRKELAEKDMEILNLSLERDEANLFRANQLSSPHNDLLIRNDVTREAEIDRLRARVDELMKELDGKGQLEASFSVAKRRLESIEAEFGDARVQIEVLQAQIQEKDEVVKRLRTELKDKKVEVVSLMVERDDLEARAASSDVLSETVAAQARTIAAQDDVVSDLKSQLSLLVQAKESASDERLSMSRDISLDLREKLELSTEKVSLLESEKADLLTQLRLCEVLVRDLQSAEIQNKWEHDKRVEELTSRLDERVREIVSLQQSSFSLEKELEDSENGLKALRVESENLYKENEILREQLVTTNISSAPGQPVDSSNHQLDDRHEQLLVQRSQLEAALRDALQAAQDAMMEAEQEISLRTASLQAKVQELEVAMAGLLDKEIKATARADELEEYSAGQRSTISMLQGRCRELEMGAKELIRVAEISEARLTELEAEKVKLQRELLDSGKAQKSSDVSGIDRQMMAEMEQRLRDISGERNRLEAELDTLQQQIRVTTHENMILRQRVEEVEAERDSFKQMMVDAIQEQGHGVTATKGSGLAGLMGLATTERLQKQISELTRQNAELRQLEKLRPQVMDLQQQLKAAQEDVTKAQQQYSIEVGQLVEDNRELESSVQTMRQMVETASQETAQAKALAQQFADRVAELEFRERTLTQDLQQCQQELEAAREQASDPAVIAEYENKVSELTGERKHWQKKAQSLSKDMQRMINSSSDAAQLKEENGRLAHRIEELIAERTAFREAMQQTMEDVSPAHGRPASAMTPISKKVGGGVFKSVVGGRSKG